MAENSLGNLSYKDSPVSGSTNHKADLIRKIFHEYKIALQTINKHGLIDEFRNAVKGGANHPAEETAGTDRHGFEGPPDL